ncbi:MAG: hypothetical protein DMD98_14165 [Candidatus Rokuibacteriota bacterium]|nr:MAG: hypothetical protein DMD98_14165 [Candidatus Rokubacteria bacterium]
MILSTGRALQTVVRVCCRHPAPTVTLALGLAALGVAITVSRLTFEASSLHLLPPGQSYVTRYREYSKDFGELDELIVAVRGRTVDESKAYAARLVHELRTGPIRFHHLAYRLTPQHFEGRALLYLSTGELGAIREQIFDHEDFIASFAAAPGLVPLLDAVNQQMARAFLSHFLDLGLQDGSTSGDLRFLETVLKGIRERVDRSAPYRSPWGTLLSVADADGDAGYFLSDDKSLLFILADPVGGSGSFTNDRAAIEEIRRRIARLHAEFPGVQAGVTGGPALSNDEMSTAFDDSKLAAGLAFALTLGLLLLAFRRLGQPLVMLAVLAVSLAWSLALITLTVGHLTVFSVMFISIVIGIGIDYGIYVLTRYDEERALGRGLTEALDITAARTGPGILLGALTAAGTFFALALTDFHGVQELGFVGGTALLLAFVAMLTVFPALLVLMDRRRSAGRPPGVQRTVRLEPARVLLIESLARHPTAILVGAGVLTAFSLWTAPSVGFDYNLLNLQARGAESVIWEQRILGTEGRSSFSALSTATSLSELRRKQDAFERLSSVSGVDSALSWIPGEQPARLKIIRDFAPLVAPIRVGRSPALDLDHLIVALGTLERRFELAVAEAGADHRGSDVQQVRSQIAELCETLQRGDRARLEPALSFYERQVSRDFVEKLHFLQRNIRPRPVTPDDVPQELRRKFVSENGRFLLQIHPKVNIWEREGAVRFVDELRSVDPDVTGTPVIAYESIRRMEKAYRQGTLYAFVLVGVLSAVMIRRIRETALALAPLVLGTLWAVGLMHLVGLKFNLANVWGVPLIIGASAEYGLNVVTRFVEARTYGGPPFARSTVMAVALNGLTTISGFGSLLVAHHEGIWSLGLLLTIGSGTSLIASLAVLPVLIRLFYQSPRATADDRILSA